MGSIGISSSGQAGVEIYVEGISNPMAVKRLIESHGEGAPIQAGPSIDKLAVAVFAVTAIIAAIMWWTLISRISAILLKGQ